MRLSSPGWFSRRVLASGLGALLIAGAATACGSSNSASSTASETIPVVASTNVYADIVKAVGGDKVTVTSIISKASQDPHSYEATAQDRVAVSKAKLVVVNGGGYDDFMGKLSDEAKIPASSVVNASDVSGLEPSGHGEFNEHVWYSQDAMKKLAEAVSQKLAGLDSADAQSFKDRAEQWSGKLAGIASKLAAIRAAHGGQGVAVTEPVPLYLLEEAGLVNKTPEAFSAAVESEHDVPPAALKEMQDLISSHGVKLLAFNPQTESPQTEALKTFATAAKVPVVDFTETMPEGSDYVSWMTANADAVASALDSASS